MKFDPGLRIGDKITFHQLRDIFECGSAGGMLPTKKYKTLVIILNHLKSLYKDEWKGSVLHYTGMGQIGDQKLKGTHNQILYDSNSNGFTVHLFEVSVHNEYVYRGIVKLVQEPYQVEELDKEGNSRKVWRFPVQPVISKEEQLNAEADESLVDKLANVTDEEIEWDFSYEGRPKEKEEPIIRDNIKIFRRDNKVALHALSYAKFLCEINNSHPTFIRRKTHLRYVEPHHLVPMKYSERFEVSLDVEENIVSLCSNCHNQLHYGKDYEELLKDLYNKRKVYLARAGIEVTFEELKKMYL